MQNKSSFERVAGNISAAEKEQILRDKAELFNDQIYEDLKGKEREKTPEEMEIISLVNDMTNRIRRKYDLENFDVPPENIHIITEKKWPKGKSTAFFNSMLQGVAMRERLSRLAFMKTAFHEMLHFKSYNAAHITTGENPYLAEYRLGLTVNSRDGQKRFFVNMNEAVTEEMTRRHFKEMANRPLFAEEVRMTMDTVHKNPDAITDSGQELFNEDTFFATEEESGGSWRASVDRLFGSLFGSHVNIITENFVYKEEREMLSVLIDKIFNRNREMFKHKDAIFDVFAKGMMTGDIIPLGKLIDTSFGKGTFRKIGELDHDLDAQRRFVESL